MSNTDKTRQKLVNSMRKSKDEAAKRPVPKTATAKKASPGKTPAKTKQSAAAATRAKSIQSSRAAVKAVATSGSSRGISADRYQSAGRVWPD